MIQNTYLLHSGGKRYAHKMKKKKILFKHKAANPVA